MEIFASKRFLGSYQKAGVVVQRTAEHAVHDFIRCYREDPANTVRRYDRVAGIRKQVLEIDISGSGRLLGHFARGKLTLLDMWHKRIVPRYNEQQLLRDMDSWQHAPTQFWPESPSGFFSSYPDIAIQPYGMELHADWLYWLDEEQADVLFSIQGDAKSLIALLLRQGGRIFFIIGGPGTGKSCLLLNLLKYYTDEGFDIGLVMSDELVSYIEQSTGGDIQQYKVNLYSNISDLDVLLVDDPANTVEVSQYSQLVANGAVRVLVLVFDPLQLDDSLSDHEYYALVKAHQAQVYALTTCYRQKKNVGAATKSAATVIADSTPFLHGPKIETYRQERAYLTGLANDLNFRNPRGYTEVYESATVQHVFEEMRRINKPNLLWQHWYSLLVVEPRSGALRSECYDAMNQVKAKIITLDEIRSIKGLEFQHVFLFLERDLYEQVEYGFKGSGQRIYNQRRLLRIPFSRAKDSLVTFVLDSA